MINKQRTTGMNSVLDTPFTLNHTISIKKSQVDKIIEEQKD